MTRTVHCPSVRSVQFKLTSQANLDEHQEPEDIDEETTGHLHREIEKAEEEGHPQGKPGSFLNKLVSDSLP